MEAHVAAARRYNRYGQPVIEGKLRLEEGLHAALKRRATAAKMGLEPYIRLVLADHINSDKEIGIRSRRRAT